MWHIHTGRELLRIKVPNVGCSCVAFSSDGGAILSGWSDGKVRAFGPQSGKLLYTFDAHLKAVKAVAATHDPQRLITGGEDGMVRIWEVRHSMYGGSGKNFVNIALHLNSAPSITSLDQCQ